MNSLLILENETVGKDLAVITGSRAERLLREHDLKAGLKLKVAVLNRELRSGLIAAATPSEIRVELKSHYAPPPRAEVDLIAGVARPQTIKKLLQTSAAHGINSVRFIKTEHVEKSYLQSKTLEPANIENEIHLGLQQTFDCFSPSVSLHPDYKRFIAGLSDEEERGATVGLKIFADVPRLENSDPLEPQFRRISGPVVLALGPEAGWSDKEREDFKKLGFVSWSLGPRQYRTETALAMLLGQLTLMRGYTL